MTDEYRNKNKYIIEHYGVRAQMKYMMTEVFELIEAIMNEQKSWKPDATIVKQRIDNVAEEIADVFVFLDQFCSFYGLSWDEIYKIAEKKIDRQIERIMEEDKK